MKSLNTILITGLVLFLLTGIQGQVFDQNGTHYKTNLNASFEVKTQILIAFTETSKTSIPSVVKTSTGLYSSRSYISTTPQSRVIFN